MNEDVIGHTEWVWATYRITTRIGPPGAIRPGPPATVEGKVKGLWGIHPKGLLGNITDGPQAWKITHLPSGVGIQVDFNSMDAAKGAVAELDPLGDWAALRLPPPKGAVLPDWFLINARRLCEAWRAAGEAAA